MCGKEHKVTGGEWKEELSVHLYTFHMFHPAGQAGIHLRAGMHCNPGAASAMLGLPPEAIAQLAQDNLKAWETLVATAGG